MKTWFIIGLFLFVLISCYRINGHWSHKPLYKAKIITNYTCEKTNLIIKSDVILPEKDLKRACSCYDIGKDSYIKSNKEMKSNYNIITVNYFTPFMFYTDEDIGDYAYCKADQVYIKIFDTYIGTPDIHEFSYYECEDKQFLLFHELYHVWSQDKSEDNANDFAREVPLC